MATVSIPRTRFSTLADLLVHLGGIPARRVRLRPTPGTATEKDVIRIHAREKRLCELIDGVLVEKPIGYFESYLAGVIIQLIRNFLDKHSLGIVAGESGMLRLTKGLVRIPDVSFVSWKRLPGRHIPREPIPDLVPDLAIEVLSRSNTRREMARKLDDYFAAGVHVVWFVDPRTSTVQFFSSPAESVTLRVGDRLSGGELLPGFSVPVKKFFELPKGRSS